MKEIPDEIVKAFMDKVGYLCGMLEEYPDKKFKGGCGELVIINDAYRCADCTASFHRKCIREHFKYPLEIIPPLSTTSNN